MSVGQRHQEEVLQHSFERLWACNGEGLLVDGLIDQLIDDTLWNTLGLAHHFLFQEYFLPIELITVGVSLLLDIIFLADTW